MGNGPVRYGEILIGQDFRLPGKERVWRRFQGRASKPVEHIGGHVTFYGGSDVLFEVDTMVERANELDSEAPVERPRG